MFAPGLGGIADSSEIEGFVGVEQPREIEAEVFDIAGLKLDADLGALGDKVGRRRERRGGRGSEDAGCGLEFWFT